MPSFIRQLVDIIDGGIEEDGGFSFGYALYPYYVCINEGHKPTL
jgi:hypothetical protein